MGGTVDSFSVATQHKTPSEMDQQRGGTRPIEFASDVESLRTLFAHFCSFKGEFAPNAMFGEMSKTAGGVPDVPGANALPLSAHRPPPKAVWSIGIRVGDRGAIVAWWWKWVKHCLGVRRREITRAACATSIDSSIPTISSHRRYPFRTEPPVSKRGRPDHGAS
jgi:hypothetical protein